MTSFRYRFDKVLNLREQERDETEMAYKEAIEEFEKIATQLYDQMKKKENVLEEQQQRMTTGFSIDDLHSYSRFINTLDLTIDHIQQEVMKSRSKMNWYESQLLEKNIEVKKFEKMKEIGKEQYNAEMEHVETNRIDELSTMKFRSREDGW
ncbi:flagellar export protein FliJ [Sporosarcina sp. P21c]|uniref:flagellar export protein FliJ n=1 Tax=Sporosarcina TaxID=1569 RepID=UPI000A166972|nr:MULTISPECIES: flagellar export protein FliJ [Sporosarcina]ARJ40034.1 flagellar biosynthesis chaperone [Sporosarcina ureae]PIC68770.1 flagellar export protein FliJ [Sporosarcina sp. P16a]PIC84460.1 flagellar export protein FliJ [Sporosarcina sp. P1]PIC91048.1 flagellar export protein FliJ [Sporosarcina sp. P21c]PIC92096.1 flagellar export protein FliJ [Sporosarcina sp. P25]